VAGLELSGQVLVDRAGELFHRCWERPLAIPA